LHGANPRCQNFSECESARFWSSKGPLKIHTQKWCFPCEMKNYLSKIRVFENLAKMRRLRVESELWVEKCRATSLVRPYPSSSSSSSSSTAASSTASASSSSSHRKQHFFASYLHGILRFRGTDFAGQPQFLRQNDFCTVTVSSQIVSNMRNFRAKSSAFWGTIWIFCTVNRILLRATCTVCCDFGYQFCGTAPVSKAK
jgi:hypothetical protein